MDDVKLDGVKLNGSDNRSLVTRRDTALMEYYTRESPSGPYPSYQQEAPTFRDSIMVLFRQKKVILAVLVATLAVTYLGLELHTPRYEAQAKLLIRAEKLIESSYYKSTDNAFKTEIVLTQSEVVKSRPVLERTVKALQLDERPLDLERRFATPVRRYWMDLTGRMGSTAVTAPPPGSPARANIALDDLRLNIKVKPVPNTNLFTVSVKDFDPEMAARIANTVAHYYIIFDLEQILADIASKYGEKHLIIKQLRDDIVKYEGQLNDPQVSYAETLGPASAKILEKASPPLHPNGYPSSLLMLIAAVCGLLLGLALAFMFERMDPTFRSAEDVRRVMNLPVLGSIPVKKFGFKYFRSKPMISTRYSRSFKDLADRMFVLMNQESVRSVLVTSCSPREGASLVAANLGLYLSRTSGRKVLLIDANFDRPSLNGIFHLPKNDGLSDVLSGSAHLADAVRRVNDNLDVLTTRPHEHSLLTNYSIAHLKGFIQRMNISYGMVLIDASNLKNSKDPEILSAAFDGTVLVMDPGRARRQAVRATLEGLERKRTNILGVVLNRRVYHMPQMFYGQV